MGRKRQLVGGPDNLNIWRGAHDPRGSIDNVEAVFVCFSFGKCFCYQKVERQLNG